MRQQVLLVFIILTDARLMHDHPCVMTAACNLKVQQVQRTSCERPLPVYRTSKCVFALDMVTCIQQVQMGDKQGHSIALMLQQPDLAHGLDDEAIIMRQKEHAARLAWGWQFAQCLVPCKIKTSEFLISDTGAMPLYKIGNCSFAWCGQ